MAERRRMGDGRRELRHPMPPVGRSMAPESKFDVAVSVAEVWKCWYSGKRVLTSEIGLAK